MIILDYKDRRPIYEQVAEKLEELMLLGILGENEPLPSVRSLAMELSINPEGLCGAGTSGIYLYSKREGKFCGRKQCYEGKTEKRPADPGQRGDR